ncbi:RNA polymerase sigma-70 factor (ECF subfamily) [Pedobacter metabolipauper]|uniref:RNA polymerase sigma-70 factor (ECF subfamily) n=2 Tax=Pedobacter metabolipauper TaxID=425513 RepID=A0A4R6T1D2_9SPHI|nr:RNA polymerase sigma-70 factor (ECF subfamily) [Pedobacter metabolipauper]
MKVGTFIWGCRMSRSLLISDDDLLSLFKEGDRDAFKMIYERYWQLLFVSACKVLKDEDEAKDVVQEVFMSFLNRGKDIEINSSISVYLYSAVRYKVFDYLSRQKVRDNHKESVINYVSQVSYSTDRTLIEKEIIAEIEKEIKNLPEKMREVFELSRKDELSYKQIAETLNISDKTVKKQISNAIKLLKPKFTNYYSLVFVICFKFF